MPIKLSTMTTDKATAVVKYGSEEALINYRPSVITAKKLKAADEAQETGDMDPFFGFLCEVIIDWDILDENKQQVPVTVEVMNDIPLPFLGRVFRQIMKEAGDVGEAPRR